MQSTCDSVMLKGVLCPVIWHSQICLLCRRRGHSLKNCPDKNERTVDKKLCYNCGEIGHSLANCPQPLQDGNFYYNSNSYSLEFLWGFLLNYMSRYLGTVGGTKFASCFICNESGHLSKNCPKNTHGIYPKVFAVMNSRLSLGFLVSYNFKDALL